MQDPLGNVFLPGQHLCLHRLGHGWAERIDANHAFFDPTPQSTGAPGAIAYSMNPAGVVVTPLVGDGQHLRIRTCLAHVRVVGHCQLATFLRSSHHCRRTRVEHQHLGTLVHQRHGGITLPWRVEPFAQPHHPHLCRRVDRAHAQRERIDTLNHLWDGEARHIARLTHQSARRHTRQIAPLVVTRIRHRHVGRSFVTRDRFKLHIRKLSCDLQGRLHVAKAGGEDDVSPVACQVANDTLGVWPFGHVFHKTGDHLRCLTSFVQRRLHGLAGIVVLARPPGFGDGRHVHKRSLRR